jgi:SAM-dependent methyltransferase
VHRLSTDQIIRQVKAEWARRRGGLGAATAVAADAPEISPWLGAMPDLPMKPAYALEELLAYSDMAFVRNAYAVVLRRGADPDGLSFYLHALRHGHQTKVEVLAALRWSEEGRSRGVHIDGLLVPYTLQKWKRKRFVGPILAWLHGFSRLGSASARMAMLESCQARELEGLGAHLNRFQGDMGQLLGELRAGLASLDDRLTGMEERAAKHASGLQSLNESLGLLSSETRDLDKRAGEMASALDERTGEIADVRDRTGHLLEGLQALASRTDGLEALRDRTEHLVAGLQALGSRTDRLEGQRERDLERVAAEEEAGHALDPLYVAFETEFRGESKLIRARMSPYLDILREANVGDSRHPVLDVGCGNGDWLDVLRDQGMSARGVDSNRLFVELCRGRGLSVAEGDALQYLRGLGDGSLGAVTGMHIAEHLPFETLVQLIDECRRVLCIGGVIALETPNPEHLLVASNYFYNDPTHRNPLPPDTLRWLVEARGFERCRIERWKVARDMHPPPLLDSDVPGAASVNALLVHLHAAPDYAVIGRRL